MKQIVLWDFSFFAAWMFLAGIGIRYFSEGQLVVTAADIFSPLISATIFAFGCWLWRKHK